MTYSWGHDEVDFSGEYNFSSDIDISFDSDVNITSDVDVDYSFDVCVDVEGNSAVFNLDVQSYGDDGAVELNLVVFTNEDYASITASGFSVTG
ncbi:hypothetical protein [Aureimonas glaciei]|uniref:Uncharacterized protein n=1 Tax=Aureimonas glaciei TaxID=1776957 RepID=A0A916Y929_9HYPH|nr:hypothetical protein [Aureimonas glaciei]GGD34639.1 hypothetical protein GCM10011335_42090 [Aureimonas glaciei]